MIGEFLDAEAVLASKPGPKWVRIPPGTIVTVTTDAPIRARATATVDAPVRIVDTDA
jgi:hypothetical protein